MPTIKKLLPLLAAMFLVLACGGTSNSGSTNPITPTTAQATASMTLLAGTQLPTVTAAAVTPAATGTATLTATPASTATVSPTATSTVEFTFSPLKVIQVSTFRQVAIEQDATGWPTVVVAPRQGHIFFAFRCEGEKRTLGFVEIEGTGDTTVLRQNCPQPGRSEIILIFGAQEGSILLQGFGDILARKSAMEKDLAVYRYLFEMDGGQMVVWLQKP